MTESHSQDAHPLDREHPRCRVRIGSADGVLAIVPHLLGFHPADSLVVLGIGGPHDRIRVTFRYDLPQEPHEEEVVADIAEHAAEVLSRQKLPTAIAIGYGAARIVTPVVDAVIPALQEAGIAVQEVLRVHDGRFWSYLCAGPACCPAEGVPFDPDGHPAAATLAAAGQRVRASRSALAATIAPRDDTAESMSQASDRARRRAGELLEQSLGSPLAGDLLQPVADAGRRSVRLAVTSYRRGGEIADHDELAWLGLVLTDLRVRDDAWARMDPEFNTAHQRLWTDLVRHLPAALVAAPAALLAFTAWQCGNGALACIAIDRALEADPGYSMALLIGEALQAGLPPSAARLPMTPKQVAASYAGSRRNRRRKPASSSRGTREAS